MSKSKAKAALRLVLAQPGNVDEIWDGLLGTHDEPRERLVRALAGVKEYDDRAAVLVFAAMVEQYLEIAITAVLKTPPAKTAKLFLYESPEGGGPLSTFAAKIKMGEALGLYEESMTNDLNMMKLIRNVFAHARVHVDFKHEAVMAACNALDCVKSLKSVGLEVGHRGKAFAINLLTARQKYIGAAAVFTILLAHYRQLPTTDAAIAQFYARLYNKAL
jgi:hypothetical protein